MYYINCFLDWFSVHSTGIVALGVIISAFVSVWVAYYTTSKAARNQISALRVSWIEAQREDVATLLKMSLILDFGSFGNRDEAIKEVYESKKILNRILLRLNLSEKKHLELQKALISFSSELDKEKKDKLEDLVREKAREIFREEWLRAVDGK